MANLHVLINLTSFLSFHDDENCISSSAYLPISFSLISCCLSIHSSAGNSRSLPSRSFLNPLSFLDVITQTINLNYIVFLFFFLFKDVIANDEAEKFI